MIVNNNIQLYEDKNRKSSFKLVAKKYEIDSKGDVSNTYEHISYFNTKHEAEIYANKYYRNYNPTLKIKDLYEGLLKKKSGRAKGTLKDYDCAFNKLKKISNQYINTIEVSKLNDLINSFDSYSIRKRVKILLAALLRYAYQQNLLEENLSEALILHKCENKNKLYTNPFTLQELKTLANNDYDDITYDIISFMIHTGIGIYDTFDLTKECIANDLSYILLDDGKAIQTVIKTDDTVKKILEKNLKSTYLFETKNKKQFEYSVFRRYYWNPYMKHYKLTNHQINDCYATYIKYERKDNIMIDIKDNKATKAYVHYRADRVKKYAVEIKVYEGTTFKRKTIASYEFKWEAEAAVEEYNAMSYGLDRSKYQLTFSDVYFGLVKHREQTGKAKDANCYIHAFKALDFMHDKTFYNITKNDLQEALYKCNKNGPTIKVIIILLHQMYTYAIGEKIVSTDESVNIDLGRHSELMKNPNKISRVPFRVSEINDVLSDDLNPDMRDIFKVLLYTGMRINELLTLTKDAVDIRNNVLNVKEEFSKTKSSNRQIPIHPDIFDIIKKKYKDAYSPDSQLFCQLNGNKFVYQNFVRSYWNPFMEAHNLGSHNPHDTRHTFSTFWKYCGLDEFYGEIILGHSTKSTVRGLYKTPDISYLYNELCNLRFDIEPGTKKEKVVEEIKDEINDLNEFKKAKEEMDRLGFNSFAEYNEYLEYKKTRMQR